MNGEDMTNRMKRKALLIVIVGLVIVVGALAGYGSRKKTNEAVVAEHGSTGALAAPRISLEPIGEWSKDRDNKLRIVVDGLAEPALLVIDFGPTQDERFVGAKPNVPNATFVEGVPIAQRVQENGSYEITFHTTAFSLTRWFGQGEHALPSWRVAAYLATKLSVQTLPEAGVKHLGQVKVLEAADLPMELSIVSAFRSTTWTNCISPTQVYFISQSPGGLFAWVQESHIISKASVFLNENLEPASVVGP